MLDEVSYQKLLTTRICDLELDIEETIKPYFNTLKKELKNHNITLWPDFYFGDEWGCVDKTISICIPFYFADEELKKIQGRIIKPKSFMKILRHETGHAVNYAYKLWKTKKWKETFGDFNKKYPNEYIHKVNPWSKSHVKYLHHLGEDPHYAQKHPDEDWAETFAVWLDPKSRWESKYKNWPTALEKLYYVDGAIKEIAGTKPLNKKKKHDGDYLKIEDTVADWWGLGEEQLDAKLQEYFRDMNDMFIKPEKKKRNMVQAQNLLNWYARQLTDNTSEWIQSASKPDLRKCLRQWEEICEKEGLYYLEEEEDDKVMQLATLLTYYALEKKLKN